MSCLNCAKCLGYVDGRFGPILAEDGGLMCDDQGRLVVDPSEIPPVLNNDPAVSSEQCGNRVHVNAAGELWADPSLSGPYYRQVSTSALNITLPASAAPGDSVVVQFPQVLHPPNASCYSRQLIYSVTVVTFIIVTGGETSFRLSDWIKESGTYVENAPTRHEFSAEDPVSYKHTSSYIWTDPVLNVPNVRPDYDFQVQAVNLGVAGTHGTLTVQEVMLDVHMIGIGAPERC